jgi:hypothetical protein
MKQNLPNYANKSVFMFKVKKVFLKGKKECRAQKVTDFFLCRLSWVTLCAAFLWCFSCATSFGKSANDNGSRILIGAIRWDGWVSNASDVTIGTDLESILKPIGYQSRLPFYTVVTNPNYSATRSVKIDGRPAAVMNKEIEFARTRLDLDYWAFNVYENDASLSTPFNTYLAATRTDKPNFCFILEASFCKSSTMQNRVLGNMLNASYQTVAGGRPILYLFAVDGNKDTLITQWGSLDNFKNQFWGWRNWVKANNGGYSPYVVIMEFNEQVALYWKNFLGADAISTYAMGVDDGSAGHTTYPYSTLTSKMETLWMAQRLTYAAVVPTAIMGWNGKPFEGTTFAWNTANGVAALYPTDRDYAQAPTPAQAAQHVANCMNFLNQYPTSTPARTMLIYAWNEFAEGGPGLCPAYDPNNPFVASNNYFPYTTNNTSVATPGFDFVNAIGDRIKPYHN